MNASPLSFVRRVISLTLMVMMLTVTSIGQAATAPEDVNGTQVLEAFGQQQAAKEKADQERISLRKKYLIMFMLGIPLLTLLLATGAVGIAVGIFGKPWFLLHMILAGLTMSLALVHVVVGLVWFFPF